MPHWFNAGTEDVTHGCPITPPILLEDSNALGQWKITLLKVSDPFDYNNIESLAMHSFCTFNVAPLCANEKAKRNTQDNVPGCFTFLTRIPAYRRLAA